MKQKCNTTRETLPLELQITHYRRKLERERLIEEKLNADLASILTDLSSKQALSRNDRRFELSLTLAERQLRLKTEQMDELLVKNATLKAEIDTLRVALNQDRDFISTTKAQIATISLQAERVRTQGAQHSLKRHFYDLQIRSLSLPKTYSPTSALSVAVPRPKRPVAFSLTPIPLLGAPLRDVFTHLVDGWKERVIRQREAVERHKDYIGRLEEGFGRVRDCSLQEFVKLFLGWYESDLALKGALCLFQDEIVTLEASIRDSQMAIQRLKQQQMDTLAGSFEAILSSAPYLSRLLSASGSVVSAETSISTLRNLVETHCKEQASLGTVAVLKASSLSDHLCACWLSATDLHITLAQPELGLQPLAEKLSKEELKKFTVDQLVNGLAALICELELPLERLISLRPAQRRNPGMQGRVNAQSLFVTAHILEDSGPNYALSTREFQARAAAKVSLPV